MAYTWTNQKRRWHYLKDVLIDKYGAPVYKVGVDAGFTCPNRDGTKAFGGCAYCSQEGSLSPHQDAKASIKEQFAKGAAFVQKRYGAKFFIPYYQSFTNTYSDIPTMQEKFDLLVDYPNVVGISLSTRPDCLDEEKVKFLAERYARKLDYFTVELGLQSVYQNRLDWVNRKESVADYINAMKLLNKYHIPVVTHVILGFPGETYQDMLDTVRLADAMKSQGIKLQLLHVIKKTQLEYIYNKNPFKIYSLEEYRDLILSLVERIRPEMVIHRISGETQASKLVAPDWVSRHKTTLFVRFEEELEKRNTWQGKFYDDSKLEISSQDLQAGLI